jgi:hypothetical protein
MKTIREQIYYDPFIMVLFAVPFGDIMIKANNYICVICCALRGC